MRDYDLEDATVTLLLGYALLPEPAIPVAVRELAAAVEAS
jgi:hypothetical protein